MVDMKASQCRERLREQLGHKKQDLLLDVVHARPLTELGPPVLHGPLLELLEEPGHRLAVILLLVVFPDPERAPWMDTV